MRLTIKFDFHPTHHNQYCVGVKPYHFNLYPHTYCYICLNSRAILPLTIFFILYIMYVVVPSQMWLTHWDHKQSSAVPFCDFKLMMIAKLEWSLQVQAWAGDIDI